MSLNYGLDGQEIAVRPLAEERVLLLSTAHKATIRPHKGKGRNDLRPLSTTEVMKT